MTRIRTRIRTQDDTGPDTARVARPARRPQKPKAAGFDPNALQGFSTKGSAAGAAAQDAFLAPGVDATRSVAIEERDDASLLNYYRRLIALHHDSMVIRTGGLRVFDHDAQNALVWVRMPGPAGGQPVVVVCNMTPNVLHNYRVPLPQGGIWTEILNSDAAVYGGSGVGNMGQVVAQDHGAEITLPPLATMMFAAQERG